MESEYTTMRGFAKIMGCSDKNVAKWVEKGRISEDSLLYKDGAKSPMIHIESAKQDIEENIDKKFQLASRASGNGAHTKKGEKSYSDRERAIKSVANASQQFGEGTYTEQDMQDMKYNDLMKLKEIRAIQLADVKIGEASRELVRADRVYEKLFTFAVVVRDAILAIPDRTVGDLALAGDENEMHRILTEEINSVLTQLSTMQEDVRIQGD